MEFPEKRMAPPGFLFRLGPAPTVRDIAYSVRDIAYTVMGIVYTVRDIAHTVRNICNIHIQG